MATLWFVLLVAMLATFVVLDGFDLGAGALHLAVARTDAERRQVLHAIGPYWDGNEVWLLAAGGVLFLAFPPVYAAALSGFYLPLMLALWLLIVRGVSIELRSAVDQDVWRSFWDAAFSYSSLALSFVLGVALGNVLRGVPLDANGDFFVPFWTGFIPGAIPGALDWYTVAVGLLASAALSTHGACFLALKTDGELRARAHREARRWALVWLGLAAAALPATALVRPASLDGFRRGPWGAVGFAVIAVGGTALAAGLVRGRHGLAFAGSSAALVGLLASAAVGVYPYLLPASGTAGGGVTVQAAASGPHALSVALGWWLFGTSLAAAYFALSFFVFRGKVRAEGNVGY